MERGRKGMNKQDCAGQITGERTQINGGEQQETIDFLVAA